PEPDAWIVPARRDDLDRVAVNVDRTPRHLDARRRFQRDTDENILSARYSAEYSPCRILREAFRRDLVAVLAAALADAAEAVADLDALHGVDAHHRARDLGVELVEDRLAESRRDAGRDHVDPCADGVAFAAQLDHERLEPFDLRRIRAEERVRIDGIEIHRVELDRTELGEITANANTDALEQVFPRDRAGRDPHRGLAGGGPSAAAIISEPVLLVVGVIRVARTVAVLDLLVIVRALVDVLDQQADRRAGRFAFEHAREDTDAVRLATLRDEARLPGTPPIEILLNVLLGQRQTGRTAVDDATERRPVAFAEGRDRERLAERVARHVCSVPEPRLRLG